MDTKICSEERRMAKVNKNSCKRLILGSAQWGSKYGISNNLGETSKRELSKLLRHAFQEGVSLIDTAPVYGNAELKIGATRVGGFDLVSKIPNLTPYSKTDQKLRILKRSVAKSISDLEVHCLYGLLFHNCEDLITDLDRILLAEVHKLKQNGFIKKIGVSVYSGTQIDAILEILTPDIVQLPFNVLDQRLMFSGHLEKLKQLGVEIHARSIFLQGLLHISVEKLPKYFRPLSKKLLDFRSELATQNLTVNQGALTFVRDHPFIDKILIGIESLSQLKSALNDFVFEPGFKSNDIGIFDEKFLNPSKWKLENDC